MRRFLLMLTVLAAAGCDADRKAAEAAPPAEEAGPAAPVRAITASFDCDRAHGQAQELVCGDANLAAIDREIARLTGLAKDSAGQAEWNEQRDSCGKADELRQCVMAAGTLKIHRLRQASEAARLGEGLSIGPVAFTCRGLPGPVLATFVDSDPGAMAIEWGAQAIAIDRALAASGARYEGRWNGEPYIFWNKGKEATFTVPGKGDLHCVEVAAAG